MQSAQTVERDIRACGYVPTCSEPQEAWRRQRTWGKPPIAAEFTVLETHVGVEARPAPIALRLFPTPSASAVTESTYIPAQQDADTLTSRPIRFRSHWAHCSRSAIAQPGGRRQMSASLMSPMAATGSTLWNGTSARPLATGRVQRQPSSEPAGGTQQPGPAR